MDFNLENGNLEFNLEWDNLKENNGKQVHNVGNLSRNS